MTMHQTIGTTDGVKLKDSGARQEFETGSRRDTRDGKGRFDLLQWRAIRLVARQLEEGAKKYGERNWEKGQPLSRYLDSATRHLAMFAMGLTDERHDVAVAWNILCLIDTVERIKEGLLPAHLNDLPPPVSGSTIPMPSFPAVAETSRGVPLPSEPAPEYVDRFLAPTLTASEALAKSEAAHQAASGT